MSDGSNDIANIPKSREEEAQKPTIEVDASNDNPKTDEATSIMVSGEYFPPKTSVSIEANSSKFHTRGSAEVDERGAFHWTYLIKPRLPVNASVHAEVRGTGIVLQGDADVFGVDNSY